MHNGVDRSFGIKLNVPYNINDINLMATLYSDRLLELSTSEIYAMISGAFFLSKSTKYRIFKNPLGGKRSVRIVIVTDNTSNIMAHYLKMKSCFVYGDKLLSKEALKVFNNFKVETSLDQYEVNSMFAALTGEINALFVNGNMVSTNCKDELLSFNFDNNLQYNRIGLYLKI